jgi:hypothetical protein
MEIGKSGTYLDSIQDRMLDEINRQKEALVKKKIEELGLTEELQKDPKRLFKKFVMIDDLHSWRFYYNNGTEEGLLIIAIHKPTFTVEERGNSWFMTAK